MLKTVPKLNLSIPDHTILDKIGEGGMSAVYLGRQISLQRKVAIKVLKKLVMDDKSLAERFVDEAKTVALLDHPHIISIYEAKKLPSGLAYFTMPYLTHGDLGEIICTNSDHLIELLCQICDGLSHAHKHGVIHRDLKPENVLFDQFGRIKIADFGIAISKKAKRKTKETQLLGSAHYMSPEQIQSKEIDHRSDIYSLGCIIYEKLTGDHVYTAGNDFSILMSHINKPVPELPKALAVWQPIINQCLAKDPEDRYQSVEALKDALLEIRYNKTKQHQPIKAAPAWLTTLKKPAVAMGALATLAVLIMAVLWLSSSGTPPEEPVNGNLAAAVAAAADQQPEDEPEETPVDDAPLELTIGVIDTAGEGDEDAELVDLTGNLDNEQINEMSLEVTLAEAQELLSKYRLTKPKGDNAADKFQQILLEYPDHAEAQKGLNQVGVYYFRLIESKLKDQETADALKHTRSLVSYINEYNIDRSLFERQVSEVMSTTDQLVTQAVNNRRKNQRAEDYLAMAALLLPDYEYISQLRQNYQAIPYKGQRTAGPRGHQLVFMPAGSSGNLNDFQVMQSEVTVAQFKAFAGEQFADEKCHHFDKQPFFKKTWLKPPFDQADTHPVVCVSFNNARAYAEWLSQQTGDRYRLPTAQEWQYLNRAIKTAEHCDSANLAGQEIEGERKATDNPHNCSDQFVFTAPVNSYTATGNINDFNGNVAEWVSNCSAGNACAAGSSWRSGQGKTNVMLQNLPVSETHSHVGFRLIKEI
ncbi:protein kinase [Marinicella sediminis]|uniref:Protein kinase n=1 Tax=Marinicella sediminis TaxID=1792834 RepID=A0ABV7JH20_9GAMM|nr:bifunctional serine/threonine-protein kinase/formylglycine-generating enzyme family protein [Marinicella sediminis]